MNSKKIRTGATRARFALAAHACTPHLPLHGTMEKCGRTAANSRSRSSLRASLRIESRDGRPYHLPMPSSIVRGVLILNRTLGRRLFGFLSSVARNVASRAEVEASAGGLDQRFHAVQVYP